MLSTPNTKSLHELHVCLNACITERVFYKNQKGIPSLGTQYMEILKGHPYSTKVIAMQDKSEQRPTREALSLSSALRGFPGRECKAFDSSADSPLLAKNVLPGDPPTMSLPDFLPTTRLVLEIPLLTPCNLGPRSLRHCWILSPSPPPPTQN